MSTYIYSFKLVTRQGTVTGRIEAHDHQEARERAMSTVDGVYRGEILLIPNQEKARALNSFIPLESAS